MFLGDHDTHVCDHTNAPPPLTDGASPLACLSRPLPPSGLTLSAKSEVHNVAESDPAALRAAVDAAIASSKVEQAKGPNPTLKPTIVFVTTNSGSSSVVAAYAATKGVPVISCTATSSGLSSPTAFPVFIRVTPSDQHAARALVAVLVENYWRQIFVLATSGSWGASFNTDILDNSKAMGITVLGHASFAAGSRAEMVTALAKAKLTTATVFVFISSSGSDIEAVFEEASTMGLVGEGYQWLAPEFQTYGTHSDTERCDRS